MICIAYMCSRTKKITVSNIVTTLDNIMHYVTQHSSSTAAESAPLQFLAPYRMRDR
jgi:F0F1-type ATP synthase alpha subunit